MFVGTLVDTRQPLVRVPGMTSSIDPVAKVFEVAEVRKGEVSARAEVLTAASGASCGLEVDEGQTYVVVEDGRVVFKADVGSVALDCCQIQGVWLAPELRGRGLATPLMAATLEQVLADHARQATLYVNDFNVPAIATYRACGMAEIGAFTTVLL